MKMGLGVAAFAAVSGLAASVASATTVEWTNWTMGTNNFPSSLTVGVLPVTGTSVSYFGSAVFRQTSGGTDYWSPTTPYISTQVSNAPPAAFAVGVGDFGIGQSVSLNVPTSGLVMALTGLGSATTATEWVFDTPFTILSSGPGFFGGAGTLTQLPGNVLRGDEGSGVILFSGTVSVVSWTIVNGEQPNWQIASATVITVGVIPAPGAAALLGVGGLLAARRRR
jgi:hypothetical protein